MNSELTNIVSKKNPIRIYTKQNIIEFQKGYPHLQKITFSTDTLIKMIENANKEFADADKELIRINKFYEAKTNYKK